MILSQIMGSKYNYTIGIGAKNEFGARGMGGGILVGIPLLQRLASMSMALEMQIHLSV